MRLKYGTYPFDANGSELVTKVEVTRNEAGIPYKRKGVIDASGWIAIVGSTPDQMQSDCTQKMNAMVTAFAKPYQDLIFYRDNGQESDTFLKNFNSINGVVITRGPDFDMTKQGYTNAQRFSFTAEAEYYLPPSSGINPATMLISFTETLAFTGGGPRLIYKEALVGAAQRQVPCQQTVYHVEQRGQAVGILRYPVAPGPKWPLNLVGNPDIQPTTPKRMGPNHYEGYGLTWRYQYVSATPLRGVPTLWTGG